VIDILAPPIRSKISFLTFIIVLNLFLSAYSIVTVALKPNTCTLYVTSVRADFFFS
jgi:hypothetical protein